MKRILVLQTTRMGDVLQTSPLVSGIRAANPDAHITVMVRRMGKAIAEAHPAIDDVIVYDEDSVFNDLRAMDSDRLLRAYTTADTFIRELRARAFDIAYNCTHSVASAMLLKLIGVPKVVGADLSSDWQFVLRGRWINYFFTSVFHREYNDLNLCDITRHFVGDCEESRRLVLQVKQEDRDAAEELLRKHGIGDDECLVCFQLGASEENKRWSEAHFAGLGGLLRDKFGARILLVGVKEEEPLGALFETAAPGLAVPLYGQTNIGQLAALLESARLLVTNDTGTMHIAAAVDCPVVLVSVGYVHFRETGPYGEGHCAVEWRRDSLGRADNVPGGLDERTLIKPEHVLKAVELVWAARDRGEVAPFSPTRDIADLEISLSRFAPDKCLQWYPVLRRPLEERDLLRMAYRAMWLEFLNGRKTPDVEDASRRRILPHYDPPIAPIDATVERLSGVFGGLVNLARRGIGVTEKTLVYLRQEGGLKEAQRSVGALMALDEEMRLYSELHPECKPLTLIARFERDNLEGSDPNALAHATLAIYRDCRLRAALMQEKLGALVKVCEEYGRDGLDGPTVT